MVDHSIEHYYALTKLDIINSWDGRSVVGPPGVIDEDGFVDLTKWKKKKSKGEGERRNLYVSYKLPGQPVSPKRCGM